MRAFVVKYGSYPYEVMVSIGQSDEARLRALKKHFNKKIRRSDNTLENQDGLCIDFGGDSMIAVRAFKDEPEWYGALSHEIFHAVFNLFNHIEMPLSESSNEAYAYVLDFLTTEIYKRLK